jgi:hypothetical protein
MTALVAYAPIVGVIAFFTSQQNGIIYSGLFTIGFWLFVLLYFYFDYRQVHKKRHRTQFPPLTSDVERSVTVTFNTPITKTVKIINWFYFTVEIFEAIGFLVIPFLLWVEVEVNGVLVLTYANGVLILSFAFGVFIGYDVLRRLRHPEKILEFHVKKAK